LGSASQSLQSEAKRSRFDAILDAAEQVFAESGRKGAKMREIAERAGVAQGLIHYHFATKDKLFDAMVARRSSQINDARNGLLQEVLVGNPTLESIVEALFRPTIVAGLSLAGDGNAFARILVSFANSAAPEDQALAKKYYDPIAQEYIAAIKAVQPGLSEEDAVWAYMFAIGVGMTMMARTGRALRLSGGICDDGNAELMLGKIVPFICGGILALATT